MKQKTCEEIQEKIDSLNFREEFDLIVTIGRGGLEPAKLFQKKLGLKSKTFRLYFRDDNHQPMSEYPQLKKPLDFNVKGKRVLLIDDVSRSGKTLEKAKEILKDASLIKTLVINGKADYSLYNEDCFIMPWGKKPNTNKWFIRI